MSTLLKLASRNIWRNKRRTLITAASILFGVFFASVMRCFQVGAWDNMINSVVKYYFGYAQIHKKGYWEEISLDKSMEHSPDFAAIAKEHPEIIDLVPRLESFALASAEKATKGVMVIGIDPEPEHLLTSLKDKIIEGAYLEPDDHAVLVSEGLASYLNFSLGDTIVLISSGYHGANAAGKYPIKGITKFGSPDLNKRLIHLPLKKAQYFFAADNLLSSMVVNIKDKDDLSSVLANLKTKLDPEEYEIMDYEELLPDLMEAKALDVAGGKIFMTILYTIIGFGIFGTILMLLRERRYEFGVLTAIGMKRHQISIMVWLELLFVGILGCILGMLLATPVVLYLESNPIEFTGDFAATYEKWGINPVLPAKFDLSIFARQAWIILLMITLMAIYPFYEIFRLKPIKAMRS